MANTLLLVIGAGIVPLLILGLVITGAASGVVAWQPPAIWTTQFGTPNFGNGVTALSVDSTGLYAAGYVGYSDILYLHPSPSYVFLSRYDLTGHHLWIKQLGTPTVYRINSVAVSSDGVYVSGYLNATGFLRKYDVNGNQVRFAAADEIKAVVSSVHPIPNGFITVNQGSVVSEYDSNGNIVWSRVMENSSGYASIYTTSSGFYASWTTGNGPVVAKFDLNANRIWIRSMKEASDPATLNRSAGGIVGDDHGIYVIGSYRIDINWAGFIQRYDQNGNRQWSIQVGAPDYSSLSIPGIAADSSGVYLAAQTSAGHQFLMKYDPNGNSQWSFQPPATDLESVEAAGNSLYVGGAVGGSGPGPTFIAEYAESSSLIFFGLNPPFSFLLLAGIVAGIVLTVLWQQRRWEKKARSRQKYRYYSPRRQPSTEPLKHPPRLPSETFKS